MEYVEKVAVFSFQQQQQGVNVFHASENLKVDQVEVEVLSYKKPQFVHTHTNNHTHTHTHTRSCYGNKPNFMVIQRVRAAIGWQKQMHVSNGPTKRAQLATCGKLS